MALIISSTRSEFDLTQIEKGHLIYAKHQAWDSGRVGIVTGLTKDRITVQFHPVIGNVMNHFFISAQEVAEGSWTIRWSADLEEIFKYPQDNIEEGGDDA